MEKAETGEESAIDDADDVVADDDSELEAPTTPLSIARCFWPNASPSCGMGVHAMAPISTARDASCQLVMRFCSSAYSRIESAREKKNRHHRFEAWCANPRLSWRSFEHVAVLQRSIIARRH